MILQRFIYRPLLRLDMHIDYMINAAYEAKERRMGQDGMMRAAELQFKAIDPDSSIVEFMNESYDFYSKLFRNALDRNALYPYIFDLKDMISRLQFLSSANSLVAGLIGGRMPSIADYDNFCRRKLEKYERILGEFNDLEKSIFEKVRLDVLDNLGMEEEGYLRQGRIIVPSGEKYHVFRANTFNCGNCSKEHVFLNEDAGPFVALEHAKESAGKVFGTVALASGTEDLPLHETAIFTVNCLYELNLYK